MIIKEGVVQAQHIGAASKSQIQEFIDYYKSAGIQHIAMSTKDIISTVKKLKSNGIEFLPTRPIACINFSLSLNFIFITPKSVT